MRPGDEALDRDRGSKPRVRPTRAGALRSTPIGDETRAPGRHLTSGGGRGSVGGSDHRLPRSPSLPPRSLSVAEDRPSAMA